MAINIRPSSRAPSGIFFKSALKVIPRAAGFFDDLSPGADRAVFRTNIEVAWDQVSEVLVALDVMGDRADEGIAAATNWAARKTAENFKAAARDGLTLDPQEIDRLISVTAKATETSPAANVRIRFKAEPLDRFQWRATSRGISATTETRKGPKLYARSFQNQRSGKPVARTGSRRIPIKGLRGPSVVQFFRTNPETLKQQKQRAGRELTLAVMRARDIITDEFGQRWPRHLTENDPRLNYGLNASIADLGDGQTAVDDFLSDDSADEFQFGALDRFLDADQ